MKSFGETRCMNPQKQKTKIKMVNQKKFKEIFRMSCLIGYRNSERICLMKVLQQSLGETQSKEVETLPSHLMNFQWIREQKWNRVRWAQCIYALSEGPKLWFLLVDENSKGVLQKTCWYSRAQSGTFWWLDYSGSQSSQWRKWIAEQSSTCRGGASLGNTVDTIIPV